MTEESKLSPFELEILREAVGLATPRRWGAAVGQTLEILRGSGYMSGGALTDKGTVALMRDALTWAVPVIADMDGVLKTDTWLAETRALLAKEKTARVLLAKEKTDER